jgi:DNA-binding transcriptional ArsR family regulator
VPPERALPIRVRIVAGESLDSWLEALARRNGISIGRLLPALGWHVPNTPGGLVLNVPGEVLGRLERQAGLAPGRLYDAVLDRYLPLGPVRRRGSRYCPSCLAGLGGRWLLAWRLPWVFACTRHRLLLCDTCPGCGRVPREYAGAAGLNPPGSCANSVARGRCCGTGLTAVAAQQLTHDGRQLAAQQWINALLTATGPGDALSGSPAQALNDLGIVAAWLARQSPVTGEQPGRFPPASAARTAALAAQAMTLLTGQDEDAITAIRALLHPQPGHRPVRPAGLTPQQWKRLSGSAQGRFLRALDPTLSAADRLRHYSPTPLARIPDASTEALAGRARKIPQLLWPEWAIRLTPAEGFRPEPFRSTITACLLVPGNPARSIRQSLTGLHAHRSSSAIGAVVRALGERGHGSVLAAVSRLAGYLDDCGSPIDYQRRREAIPPGVITPGEWVELCYQASAHPGEDRRLDHARRYLYQLLTGADLDDPRHELAFRSPGDRSRYLEFTDTLATPLRAALRANATGYLARMGIDEPLTWQPPAECCADLALPGRDLDDIDLQAVHQLAVTDKFPVSEVAARLGTSIGHIRLALEHVPRPARQWGKAAAPVVQQRRQRAGQILTRAFFEREYLQGGKTLRQLEAETGFPRTFLAERAREHHIPVDGTARIDPGWLREQYLARRRSYTDIAAELGVIDMTVIAAARRHGIPSRPQGVHSHPEMLTKLPGNVPRDIRRAVEGGLKGWHRLRRFQIAMTCPTIEAAATHLRTHQSALIHQFRRLERDISAPLYQPSAPGQPMRPTRRGAALLAALARPDIQALATRHAPGVSGPADSSSRYRQRMPISRGPCDAPAQQAAKLFRALADPTRLAILLTLQTGEWRIVDLAAQLGGSQANISSHLATLKESGLITGRLQGRAVYYRLTRPELAALLQAAEQLLTAVGQQAQLRPHPATLLPERDVPDSAMGTGDSCAMR